MLKMTMMMFILMTHTVHSQQWNDLESALSQAGKEQKKVLLYFSVPEACERCRALEDRVWKSQEFHHFAQARYVLATVDFNLAISPAQKAENLLIVEKYNKDGFFPFVLVLSPDGRILGKSGLYNDESPTEYIHILKELEK